MPRKHLGAAASSRRGRGLERPLFDAHHRPCRAPLPSVREQHIKRGLVFDKGPDNLKRTQ